MKEPAKRHYALPRLEQKNRLAPRLLLEWLREVGVIITERTDKLGTLHYRMLPEALSYFLPIVRQYKAELLAELRGERANTQGTLERFMALPLVKCLECQHHQKGGVYNGKYRAGRCEVRAMEIGRPARGIRCIWFNARTQGGKDAKVRLH